jgi:hypothetical protein
MKIEIDFIDRVLTASMHPYPSKGEFFENDFPKWVDVIALFKRFVRENNIKGEWRVESEVDARVVFVRKNTIDLHGLTPPVTPPDPSKMSYKLGEPNG